MRDQLDEHVEMCNERFGDGLLQVSVIWKRGGNIDVEFPAFGMGNFHHPASSLAIGNESDGRGADSWHVLLHF
ncbi:hypothetical protein WJ969_13740 [Achromobacter xylosoxidans]